MLSLLYGPTLTSIYRTFISRASLVIQTVKNLPAMWETWVQSLGWEDPLEKGMTMHSGILSMDREANRLQSIGLQRVRHNWVTFTSLHSRPYISTGKTIALIIWIFVSKVMSFLFNTLSMFVIAFFPGNNHLLLSWLWSTSTVILEPKGGWRISHWFPFFPFHLP